MKHTRQHSLLESAVEDSMDVLDALNHQQEMVMNFALMPYNGISKRLFVEWSGTSAGVIEDLIYLGWIQEDEDNRIYMEGIIREMVIENLRPTVKRCQRTVKHILGLLHQYGDKPIICRDRDMMRVVTDCTEPMMLALMENTAECQLYEEILSVYSYKFGIADHNALLEKYGHRMKMLDFAVISLLVLSMYVNGAKKGTDYLVFMENRLKPIAYREGILCGALYEETKTMIEEFVEKCWAEVRAYQENLMDAVMNRKSYMPQIEFTEREKLFLRMITIANQPKIVCYST